MASPDVGLEFLAGGGSMGERIRAYPWARTSLGEPSGWPQSLRTTVRVLLTTGHPTLIFWGPELTCLYNDAFSRSLGPEKHPAILGAPGRQAWEEVWPIVGAQIEQVLRGDGAVWHENQCVPIIRHGELQEVYWTYSYSPIDEPASPHGVGGVLVTCSETTAAGAVASGGWRPNANSSCSCSIRRRRSSRCCGAPTTSSSWSIPAT